MTRRVSEFSRRRHFPALRLALLGCLFLLGKATGAGAETLSKGQLIYVPVYSEIPFGEGHRTLNLAATLSVRNIDPKRDLIVNKVEYHDSHGALVRSYLQQPQKVRPMAAAEFLVKESDRTGAISASFIVEWSAETEIVEPIVESVMIGTASGQGISFIGQGRVVGPGARPSSGQPKVSN